MLHSAYPVKDVAMFSKALKQLSQSNEYVTQYAYPIYGNMAVHMCAPPPIHYTTTIRIERNGQFEEAMIAAPTQACRP